MAYAGGRPGVPGSVFLPRSATPGFVATGDATDLTVNSAPLEVPQGAHAMTIHCPTLAGSPATLTIQALDNDTDQAAEVWRTLSVMSGVTAVPLTAIAASGIALVYSIVQIGGGVIRFVASSTQAVAPVTIKVTFHMLP